MKVTKRYIIYYKQTLSLGKDTTFIPLFIKILHYQSFNILPTYVILHNYILFLNSNFLELKFLSYFILNIIWLITIEERNKLIKIALNIII